MTAEIDDEGPGHRDHAVVAGGDRLVADLVERLQADAWVVVEEVVEPTRAHRPNSP